LSFLVAGCDLPGKPDPNKREVPAEQVTDFKTLFGQNCAGCHGADGTLGPAPPLRDPLFRALISEAELKQVVSTGRPGTPMPAFALENGGKLSDVQIQVLVAELKGKAYGIEIIPGEEGGLDTVKFLADHKDIKPQWGAPPSVVENIPPYTQPQRGSAVPNREELKRIQTTGVFHKACASCHGDNGEGTKKYGAINDPVFLALASDQMLRRTIITGRLDLGMPGFKREGNFKSLTNQDVDELVALLRSWRNEPSAGNAPKAGPQRGKAE
jgi:mono/diheme cytochrome c family protein